MGPNGFPNSKASFEQTMRCNTTINGFFISRFGSDILRVVRLGFGFQVEGSSEPHLLNLEH